MVIKKKKKKKKKKKIGGTSEKERNLRELRVMHVREVVTVAILLN